MRSGSDVLITPNASSGVPVSHVLHSSSVVSSTGLRSWLIVLVRVFGNVVMKEKTSMSTFGPAFLNWPLPLPVDAGKGEERPRLVRLQREPVPLSWLAFIGLAERRRRRQTASLLEAILSELRLYLVVACSHALGRISIAEQDEARAAQHQLAFAIGALFDDRR
jgi:hypothetical protein